MSRPPTALAVTVALTAALTGCGSGSSTTTASPQASTPSDTSLNSSTRATTQSSTQGAGQSQEGTGSGSSSSDENGSIQAYGSEASSDQKAALSATAFSFFRAIAASDYAKVCAGLSASNRKELQAFTKAKHQSSGCPSILKMLISTRGVREARKAAAGLVSSVRVRGDTAFVLFRPKGGEPNYFVLKREGGTWKAISLAPGAPLYP